MEVILLQNVPKLGKKDDVVKVSDGYANNFLFPKNLAKPMNNQTKNELNNKKMSEAYQEEVNKKNAVNTKNIIDGKSVTLNLKHGENGKLYGAVTSKAVAEKINEEYSVNVDKKKIFFENENGNIKSAGVYNIKIKLFSDVEASMKLVVS